MRTNTCRVPSRCLIFSTWFAHFFYFFRFVQPFLSNNLVSVHHPHSTRSSSLVTVARPPTSFSLRITDRSFHYASLELTLWFFRSGSSLAAGILNDGRGSAQSLYISGLPLHAPATSSFLSVHIHHPCFTRLSSFLGASWAQDWYQSISQSIYSLIPDDLEWLSKSFDNDSVAHRMKVSQTDVVKEHMA